jgi:hypothetical protein
LALLNQIKDYLLDNPNVKAKHIAAKLGLSRKQINSELHHNLNVFVKDEDFQWTLKNTETQGNSEITTTPQDTQIKTAGHQTIVNVPENWDEEQRIVIELSEEDNKIIEAGPGSGKTAVACARVTKLIEEFDLEASKILLISFTRTAIKELRDRIEAFAKKPISVAGLQILTLDSFTWQVLRGLSDDESADLMGDYETNIKQFVQQLKGGDAQLLEYLEEFEHVILDEGQDLVGERAELAIEIIKNLEESCGVTVFADSAQAIYGFTDDNGNSGVSVSKTVVEQIMDGALKNFDRIRLNNIHRTDDLKLKKLFIDGREKLLDQKVSDIPNWKLMKQLIRECSHGDVGDIKTQNLAGKSDHLVLYRTRAEVLMWSSFLWSNDVMHKLRMSGIQQRLQPWIGRLLGGFDRDLLTKDEFSKLWCEKIEDAANACGQECEKAWALLLANVGNRLNQVRVVRLREILSRDRPPIDFLIDESELLGPVLGTIHASKGREANQVNLMLPPDNFMVEDQTSEYVRTPSQIAEEERVLFVGATRAKQKLMVGKGSITYASRLKSGRTYKKPKRDGINRRMMEVGRDRDIDLMSIVGHSIEDGGDDLQDWLWANATNKIDAEIRYSHELKCNVLYAENEDKQLGFLSDSFNKDLWELANILEGKGNGKKLNPGPKISHIRMVGVTTVVISEAHRDELPLPWRHSGFFLAPVLTGFPMVYFNKQSKE